MKIVEDTERLVSGSDQFLKRGTWSVNREAQDSKDFFNLLDNFGYYCP